MKHADEERLMRYFDGEVARAEAREIEQWVEESEEARALLADFECSRRLLRGSFHEQAGRAETIADRVMARVSVSEGSPRRASEVSRTRRWLGWGPAAGLAFAAAASFLVHLRHEPVAVREHESARAVPSEAPAATIQAAPAPIAEAIPTAPSKADGDEGASIESVDFGAERGSIFVVSSGLEETPVVWLLDEPSPSRHRMKPL